MAEARAKLNLADQALIHLVGYLALEPQSHETWEALLRELSDVLPRVTRSIPKVAEMAVAAEAILIAQGERARTAARQKALPAVASFHRARAAAAIEALRSAPTPEVAHG